MRVHTESAALEAWRRAVRELLEASDAMLAEPDSPERLRAHRSSLLRAQAARHACDPWAPTPRQR